jgi:uncharacterized ion transporter superfamily protein YfcC
MTPETAPRAPDALLIVFIVLLAAVGLTWVIPAGEFDRGKIGTRTVVVPGTYHAVEARPVPWHAVFTAPVTGFSDKDAALIIGFVLLIGGAFAVINATGAISAGIHRLVRLAGDSPARRRLIIPVLMTAFSIGGNTFGMSEEVLVFILITIPLARRMGWDVIVGVAIPFVGAGVGFAGAAFNPFTVGIAQGISELPIFSGWPLRMALWVVLTALAIIYVMRYAARIERSPEPGRQTALPGDSRVPTDEELTARRSGVLVLLGAGILALVWGVTKWNWYIVEIAGLFLFIGIVAAFVGGLGPNQTAQSFAAGARDMVTAAVVIGLSRSVLLVMQEGRIVDTILHAASQTVGGLPAVLSVQVMFGVQFVLNFIVPSGSGQAALTMPIMAPLSDLLHIPRQAAVLAFQLGDGLSNFIMPTSGVTMGVLGIAKLPFSTWLRWIAWLLVWLTAAGMVFLALGVSVVRW